MPSLCPTVTESERVSRSEMVSIRRSAQRFIRLATREGRSVLLDHDSADDRDERIDAIRDSTNPHVAGAFVATLGRYLPDYTAHEAVYEKAYDVILLESESAYLFGVAVGLELAKCGAR